MVWGKNMQRIGWDSVFHTEIIINSSSTAYHDLSAQTNHTMALFVILTGCIS